MSATSSKQTTRLLNGAFEAARYGGRPTPRVNTDTGKTQRRQSRRRMTGPQIVDRWAQLFGDWPTIENLRDLIRNKPVRRDAIAYLDEVQDTSPPRRIREQRHNDW